MTELTLCEKYKPLVRLSTRYAVVTGGRGSGKSFAIASILLARTNQYKGKTILFTRYTLTNAEVSIMPEFIDKIERGNLQEHFHQSGNTITNLDTGTSILFRGIKTSSGINTAALKSIPNLVLWVNDESEELVDEQTFDTIDLSIRDTDEHCEVWLVLNPADVGHFIYRKFFAAYGVDGGFNGVRDDVTFIHTSYLDNLDNLSPDYVERAERLKVSDPDKYAHLWLGEWARNKDGLVYPDWIEISPEQYPNTLPQWYGLDWGYKDPTAVVRECYDPLTGTLYVRQVAMLHESVPADVAPVIIADAATFGYRPQDCIIYCDSANPAGRDELRRGFSLNAVDADKRDKNYQCGWLRAFRVCYCGADIKREVSVYSYEPSKYDKTVYSNTPQDGNDHQLDALRYAAYTHLHRMGVVTDKSE